MAKSRGFSLYLLKDGFNATNALKDAHGLEIVSENEVNLPEGAVMYLADNRPSPPWWKDYWELQKELKQVQKGALVFLPVNNRWLALTFGMTHHQLLDESYEYDFGLKTTLNTLDPEKIKSTDIFEPESARRERIQSPVASDLTFFDFNQDESIVRRLTGAVKEEYRDLLTNITGASNLRITSKVDPEDMISLCSELLEMYNSEEYLITFPNLQNITPVKDPEQLNILNSRLIKAFADAPVELVLTIPEIVDYSTSFKIKYNGSGRSEEFEDVFIGDYRSYLDEKNIDNIDIELFKQHKLVIVDENGTLVKKFSIYKCFLFDDEIDGNTFHLCEGEWYRIEKRFIEKLKNTLDPYFSMTHTFLAPCYEKKEGDYNKSIAINNPNVYNLDMTTISPVGQYDVEPCDLLAINEKGIIEFVHVKISTRSSSLSHLFNQGYNSAALIQVEHESREKLKSLTNDPTISKLIEDKNFCVVFGIITKKNRENLSKNLPIFSRISLMRIMNTFKLMNIKSSVYFIEDKVDRKKNSKNN